MKLNPTDASRADQVQPGDWALDLVAPTGQTYDFYLHPVDDMLRLPSPAPLAAPA